MKRKESEPKVYTATRPFRIQGHAEPVRPGDDVELSDEDARLCANKVVAADSDEAEALRAAAKKATGKAAGKAAA